MSADQRFGTETARLLRQVEGNARSRARATEWFRDPDLASVSTGYDQRETTWSALLALELLLSCHGGEPRRLLDVGCGAGTVLEQAADRLPEGEIVGIDPSPAAVQKARARVAGRRNVRCWGAAAADVGRSGGFAFGYFDLVLVHLNLALWDDPLKGLTAIAESLAPRGVCYVVDLARPLDARSKRGLLETVEGAERDYLADQIAASCTSQEARALAHAVAADVPAVRACVGMGGLGGHPLGSAEAVVLWRRSAPLRRLLRQPQSDVASKSDNVLHLYLSNGVPCTTERSPEGSGCVGFSCSHQPLHP